MLPPPRLAGETSFGPYHPPPGWLDSLPRTTAETGKNGNLFGGEA